MENNNQNNQDIFQANEQSRYAPQQQQNFNGNSENRQGQVQGIQNELQDIKQQILNSQQKQQQDEYRLQMGLPLSQRDDNNNNGWQQQQQQQPQNNNNINGSGYKPIDYYQSQFNDNSNGQQQQYQGNQQQQQGFQKQKQNQVTQSYYGTGKNKSNPFNKTWNEDFQKEHHEKDMLSNYYGPSESMKYNNQQQNVMYMGQKNTGFSVKDFENYHKSTVQSAIQYVQERDMHRTRLGTHPEQLKYKQDEEERQIKEEQLRLEQQQLANENNVDDEIFKQQITQLRALLHNQRLISFSGNSLQAILFFFMYFLSSNNIEEKKLGDKMTLSHILVTIYFFTNQLWNFYINPRVYYEFERIRDSCFTFFMLFFSLVTFLTYIASCAYYMIEFPNVKNQNDNMETKMLNYFVILISTINIFQLLYSNYTTYMVKYPPQDHKYIMFD